MTTSREDLIVVKYVMKAAKLVILHQIGEDALLLLQDGLQMRRDVLDETVEQLAAALDETVSHPCAFLDR